MLRLAKKKSAFIILSSFILFHAGGIRANSIAQTDWRTEFKKTVEAAKQEGQVNIYIGTYEPVLEAFKKAYPEIKVVSVTGGTTEMAQRLLAERRGGKFIADVFNGGPNSQYILFYKGKILDPLKPLLILPEVVDESKWLEGKHSYADPEGKHIFAYRVSPASDSFMYNKNLLNPNEITSHWDLLNPKWKGKIVSHEPTDTRLGSLLIFFYHHPELGPEFIRQLFGTMDMTFSRDQRQMTDWLAAGKFALCISCRAERLVEGIGLPIDVLEQSVWKEGGHTTPGLGALGIPSQAPHPNAAKVFLNWYLSREGQMAFQRIGRPGEHPNSRRIDIPKGDVSPEQRLVDGRKYIDTNRAEWQETLGTAILPLAKKIMEELRKKK